MQYDRSRKLYNIFEIKGTNGSSGPSQTSSTTTSSSKGSSTKPQVLDISGIKEKTKNLSAVELKDDKDFQKGGFYLLQLDKIKIYFSGIDPGKKTLKINYFLKTVF